MRTLVVIAFLFSALVLRAHNPGLSTLRVEAGADAVEVTLQFAPPDQDGDGRASPREVADGANLLRGLVSPWFVYADERGERNVIGGDVELRTTEEMIVWHARIPGAPLGNARLRLMQLGSLTSGHREFVSVVSNGQTVTESLLSAREPLLEFAWPASVLAPGAANATDVRGPKGAASAGTYPFLAFVKLGIEHILTGYDHLLYLAGLILACRRFRGILPIITSFTVAHSLTLGLATAGAVTLPASFVEPMIAASIVYVGVENILLRDREPRRRWAGAFAFGLIHGFGFAGLLQEMGVGHDGHSVIVPLASFNLGVEFGQLSVVALVLPILAWARRQPRFLSWGLPASSAAVAAMGLYWFAERVWF